MSESSSGERAHTRSGAAGLRQRWAHPEVRAPRNCPQAERPRPESLSRPRWKHRWRQPWRLGRPGIPWGSTAATGRLPPLRCLFRCPQKAGDLRVVQRCRGRVTSLPAARCADPSAPSTVDPGRGCAAPSSEGAFSSRRKHACRRRSRSGRRIGGACGPRGQRVLASVPPGPTVRDRRRPTSPRAAQPGSSGRAPLQMLPCLRVLRCTAALCPRESQGQRSSHVSGLDP